MADIVITAASVQCSANAIKKQGVLAAAVTVTQGQTLAVNSSGLLTLADSDASSPANTPVGIALSAGSPGQTITYVTEDPSFTPGGTLVMASGAVWQSDTAGGITATVADLEAGDLLTVLGVPLTTTAMNLKIVTGGTI